MADDQSQRPYRASEPPVRSQSKAPGSDPLAELARLIGQTDPFGEFGRDAARRMPAAQAAAQVDWDTQPAAAPYRPPAQQPERDSYYAPPPAPVARPGTDAQIYGAQTYGGQNYGRQSFDDAPLPADSDLYQGEEARGYPASRAAHQHDDGYDQDHVPLAQDEEYYDDAPPSRRRLGIMAIAGVLALAVIGTAGAFGYRALFGSSGSGQPPPVIKAEAGPSKIVPATTGKDAQSNRLITERVNERGQSEKLVSREEQPVDKPATVVLSRATQQPPLGSGVVAGEPKKVRTIAIHPDQPVVPDSAPPSAALTAAPPRTQTASPARPAASPPARAAQTATADAEPDPPPPATQSAPVRQAAPASSNAPLSLNPNAPPARAAARPAPAPAPAPAPTTAPTRTASVAPAAPAAASNASTAAAGSYVQVSSQRSEAEAQSAFQSLQAKYPNQLGGRQALIHKVDLGAKGIYYRAMVGPFASAGEASDLCSKLKAAGGQCLIQRN